MPDSKDVKSILLIVIIIGVIMLNFFIKQKLIKRNDYIIDESEIINPENIKAVQEEIIVDEEGNGITMVNYSLTPELLQDLINEGGEEAIYDISGFSGSELDEAREKIEEMKLEENIDFENVTLEQAENILINVVEEDIDK